MNIQIKISGTTGSGKTSIARLLTEHLKSDGFAVANIDVDELKDPVNSDIQANRLCNLLDKELGITIETENLMTLRQKELKEFLRQNAMFLSGRSRL